MSLKLIQSIQKATELRLILPIGLNLALGDVISVAKDGVFRIEGSCRSLLGVPPGSSRPPGAKVDFQQQAGEGTVCAFRAAGTASSLFPDVPHANAGFDITLAAVDSWVLALVGRELTVLDQVDGLREPILNAYARGVWRNEWALVTGIATVDRMTLLASSSANTRVALSLGGQVSAAMPLEASLTADASIVGMNQQLIKCITSIPAVAFCTAIRVKSPWFGDPNIGQLKITREKGDPLTASHDAFWEDVDVVYTRAGH
jgi:hypothetical protein